MMPGGAPITASAPVPNTHLGDAAAAVLRVAPYALTVEAKDLPLELGLFAQLAGGWKPPAGPRVDEPRRSVRHRSFGSHFTPSAVVKS